MLDIPGVMSANVSVRGPAGISSAYPTTPAVTKAAKTSKRKNRRTKGEDPSFDMYL
jgi:hypothetical protein